VDLVNGVGENIFYGFNINHKDEALREIFGDLRFRKAMSLAINRAEIVEIVYLGQAEPLQATPADPNTVDFVTEEHLTSFTNYDPDAANALLDEMGLVDTDGDGFREQADGSNLTILLQFSNQGAPVKMHELIKTYWDAVGIRIELKEVTSDEYRDNGNAGDLDVTVWKYDGTSGVAIVQNTEMTLPPFGGPFNPGQTYGWADWMSTDGAQGIEPPDDVKHLYDVVDEFMQYSLGSDDSNRLGEELVDIHVNNLWKIGIAGNIKTPVIHHNTLANWGPYPVKTYDYYWNYPYRPFQWYFEE
jgi:peptide/nickel transport system substrate-binding protein